MPANRGKAFEQLATQIQQALSPDKVVKHNEWIRDKVTGGRRQVDVTIRFHDDGIDYLVAIECRDRPGRRRKRKNEDVRWIDELATKRDRVGAHVMVAISSEGFSEQAITSARHVGIQLRRIEEVTDEAIRGWCLMDSMVFRRPLMTILHVHIEPYDRHSDSEQDGAAAPARLTRVSLLDPIIFRVADDYPLTPTELAQFCLQAAESDFDSLAEPPQDHCRVLIIHLEPGDFYTRMDGPRRPVKAVRLFCEFRYQTIVAPITRVLKNSTITDEGTGDLLVDVVEFAPTPLGQLTMYRVPLPTGEARVHLRLQPNNPLDPGNQPETKDAAE